MKTAKRPRRHSIVIRLALFAFAVYLMVSMFQLQSELAELRQQYEEKSSTLAAVELKNQELANLLSSGSEQEMIERAARDRLGYVYKGELVFKQKK